MIANITKFSKLEPFIRYNNNKVLAQEAIVLDFGNIFMDDLKVAENIIAAYGNNVKSKRQDRFAHISLNFLPADNAVLTDAILKDIAKEYLIGIGFDSDHPYLVYKHDDTIHPHIHLVTSKLDTYGKYIASSDNFRLSQRVTRELEIRHNLTRVSSQKQKVMVQERLADAPNLRDKLNFHIKNALEVLQIQSFVEFVMYLNNHKIDVQVIARLDVIDEEGYVKEGLVFNSLTGDFKQNQRGIKASSLYLKPTKKNLDIIFKKNKETHNKTKVLIKEELDTIFSEYEKVTLSDLKTILLKNNITLNFKEDRNGKIVGTSFSDKKTGLKITGEDIGKNYTARSIASLIGDTTDLKIFDQLHRGNPNDVIILQNLEKSSLDQKDRVIDIEYSKTFDEYTFDVIETQQSDTIQNDDSLSDIDRKKINPLKKRKRRL
ncbi:relaxase/mobilization nuclease domain-containing protein [Flavobacterium sp. ZT3P35]|uniref:relaxase/mobilization nuclease domain-containing protein n=2 Tax=unclassified Flavobacterium TaxID=196869 RepID=UPI003AB00E51